MQINTPNGTLSFPQLFSPRARAEGAEPVYSCSILFDSITQQTVEFKALQKACLDVAQEKWGSNIGKGQVMYPFRDGSQKEYNGYGPGVMYISPWSKQKPGIVGPRLEDILMPDEVYAGQLVRANVTPYAWVNSGKKGVSFALNSLQLVDKTKERIDGRLPANKVFTAIDDGSTSPFDSMQDSPF